MVATKVIRINGEGAGLAALAEKLVTRLGVEEAVHVCRENSWYGVLRFIQGRQNDGIHI